MDSWRLNIRIDLTGWSRLKGLKMMRITKMTRKMMIIMMTMIGKREIQSNILFILS